MIRENQNKWSGGGVFVSAYVCSTYSQWVLASQCDLQVTKQIWHFRGSIKFG